MALTAQQRSQIRLYLGWSERFHQIDSRLEQAMNAVDMDTGDALNQVTTLLTALLALETNITGAYGRLKAMKVGSIDLDAAREIGMLRSEGRRSSGRLAALLGVEVRHDAWSGSGPRDYASAQGMKPGDGGGGSLPPLG